MVLRRRSSRVEYYLPFICLLLTITRYLDQSTKSSLDSLTICCDLGHISNPKINTVKKSPFRYVGIGDMIGTFYHSYLPTPDRQTHAQLRSTHLAVAGRSSPTNRVPDTCQRFCTVFSVFCTLLFSSPTQRFYNPSINPLRANSAF